MDDRVADGTMLRGEDCSWRKLNEDQVVAIRLRHANGATMYALAKQYGCTLQNIKRIVTHQTWKHVV